MELSNAVLCTVLELFTYPGDGELFRNRHKCKDALLDVAAHVVPGVQDAIHGLQCVELVVDVVVLIIMVVGR